MYRAEIINKGSSKFTAKTANYEFAIDTKGEGCTPPDALLASLGSCVGVYLRKYAEGSKIALGEFIVTVEADLSKESPVSFRAIDISIDLKGSSLDERRKKSLLAFIDNCPIRNTLKGSPDIRISIKESAPGPAESNKEDIMPAPPAKISPKEANDMVGKDANVKLLDVRSAPEFAESHIDGSINMPIDILAGNARILARPGQAYIVLCRAGARSPMAADMLMRSGVGAVKVLDGGITAWQKHGLPVVKGTGGISLERQVRVIAGSLVLSGIVLSAFVHPWFLGIPVFVSCGLIYAGLTDSCLMGILLMKLPYNKKLYQASRGGGTCAMS